ncbi:MAG: NTPase, partial [Moorea sp. SIO3G5]|nr:NTPase [Moorena sp. SIO3G5]
LGKVAYFMQGNQGGLAGNLISGEDLERIIKEELKLREVNDPRAVAKVMINQLRTRNFILCFMGADYYAFVHRTFLEYFCAWEFVRKFEKKQEISLEQLKTEVFGKHWPDESWHEVLRLIVGMIDSIKAGEIIEYLMAQDGEGDELKNLFLAGDCLSEVRNRYEIQSTNTELLNHFKDLIHYSKNRHKFHYSRFQAVVAVATHWQDHPDTLPLLQQLARYDQYWMVRRTAIQQLALGYKDHLDTLPLLQQLASYDKEDVRRTAIEQLAQGYQDHPDTLALLQQSARFDQHSLVRCRAIILLAQGYKDHRDTLALLQQSARSDKDSRVRRTALEQLAQGYQDHRDTLAILQESARSDKNSSVRLTALEQLAQGYQDHRDTLAILQESVRSDKDSWLRSTAIEQLAQAWHDRVAWPTANQPWLWEFLCVRVAALSEHRTLNDPFERDQDEDYDNVNPRQVALNAILKYYPNHSQTRSLLLDRAEHDPDPKLREFAQEKLAKL